MELEAMREQMIETATRAFTGGVLSQEDFELLVGRINAVSSESELVAVRSGLPAVFGGAAAPAPVVREVALSMGNLRKSGSWVDADAYRITGSMSNYRLDFMEYEGITGFRLAIDLDIKMGTLVLIVPEGWQVVVDLSENVASNVRDKAPSAPWGDNRIDITGRLHMSNIKIKYK
jgi:hypothetical protein